MNRFAAPLAALTLSSAPPAPPVLPPFGVNAHIHLPPNFSAWRTTSDALQQATSEGVAVLGTSNYYDFTVYNTFAEQAQTRGIFPLFGLEVICLLDDLRERGIKINDPGNPGKMYLCGKGFLRETETQGLLRVIRENDSARMTAMAESLAVVFADAGLNTGLDAQTIRERVADRHGVSCETVYLQERHLAQAFQEVLFERVGEPEARQRVLEAAYGTAPKADPANAAGVQNDIRSFLMKAGKPAFVPDTFVNFDHAYGLVLALGGIPCYPILADGTAPLCPYEVDVNALIADLRARGIPSAEFIPTRNTPEVLVRYALALRAAGIFVTAGTEHNTHDDLPLIPTCANATPIPDSVQALFWEGSCVVAAHQYRRARGEAGFVDAEGRPDPAYATDNERIIAYAAQGASVIAAYRAEVRSAAA